MLQLMGIGSVYFPGAVNSQFTTHLSFQRPSQLAAIPTYRVMDADGMVVDQERAPPDDVAPAEALKLYTDMLTVSIMDVIMFEAQRQGRLSFYMVSAGEEGIAVGSAAGLAANDVVFAQYRETGVFQHRGFTLDEFMNQLFANRHDVGKGRNMPIHYGSRKLHIHTISSPLATQIPQAAGAAYALKMQSLYAPHQPRRVVACYFGEGAASEGDFHAALNIAATRACPVIFICRNNGYAISTPTLEQYRGDGIASRGLGYGIDTIRVDGNDVWAMREATRRARRIALGQDDAATATATDVHDEVEAGPGPDRPVLIEAMSYRVSHHSTSDDSFAYRARVEVDDWTRRDDPLARLRKWLAHRGLWDEAAERGARVSIRAAVLAAFGRAEREQKAPLRHLFTDVYADLTEESRAQMAQLRELLDRYPQEYNVDEFEGGKESLVERE
ncbi:MAG: hypothetical protein M1826_002107 [Phylliscum demangeonii]|nr:MAG: hypothetical protein M1826_002107 [Phylliscum demangeonii]